LPHQPAGVIVTPAEADAAIVSEKSAMWPWQAEPYRLWSLLDMERHLAGNWMATVAVIQRLRWLLTFASQSQTARDEFDNGLKSCEGWLREEIASLPFSSSLKLQVGRMFKELHEAGTSHPSQGQRAIAVIDEVSFNIQEELKEHLFFVVPATRKQWFDEDDKGLFGEAVSITFPESTPEIAEAGRCFALARWTASVFHLMRALELALHKWALELGVDQFNALELENWKNILDAARKKIEGLEQQPKSIAKDAELQYYGETRAHFLAVKDAWRNHVAHARERYDEGRAQSILTHAREFMQLLATRKH
jgi:hypothetical protein